MSIYQEREKNDRFMTTEDNMSLDTLGIVGVPVSKGQRRDGTEKGPQVLRDGGLIEKLTRFGWNVTDYGDVNYDYVDDDLPYDHVRNPRHIASGSLNTADQVERCLRAEGRCIALGGDHSMAIGTVMGHARVHPDMAVLWIDAHADINTPLTSESGNIHGMPLSFLAHELDNYISYLPGWEEVKPCISVDQVAWIGLRDVDPLERAIVEKFNMNSFSMQEVDQLGIRRVLDMALEAVDPTGTKPIHVSFDVDSMDPLYTPSTGTPVSGGLSLRELCYIAEIVAQTGRLAVIDIAEVNPTLGDKNDVDLTVKTTIDVISHFYGQRRQGNAPEGAEIPLSITKRVPLKPRPVGTSRKVLQN
ncbi:arginase-1-like [Dreissena polymorpha]|uniref:arginase-1-like n=1 Tax=Dreissena polymorpha TaxID=45954 RepID=UPI002264BEE9|nr:arginase-1-like [Dreissena polymorpha]